MRSRPSTQPRHGPYARTSVGSPPTAPRAARPCRRPARRRARWRRRPWLPRTWGGEDGGSRRCWGWRGLIACLTEVCWGSCGAGRRGAARAHPSFWGPRPSSVSSKPLRAVTWADSCGPRAHTLEPCSWPPGSSGGGSEARAAVTIAADAAALPPVPALAPAPPHAASTVPPVAAAAAVGGAWSSLCTRSCAMIVCPSPDGCLQSRMKDGMAISP